MDIYEILYHFNHISGNSPGIVQLGCQRRQRNRQGCIVQQRGGHVVGAVFSRDVIGIAEQKMGHVNTVTGLYQLADIDIVVHFGKTELTVFHHVRRAAGCGHGEASPAHVIAGAVRAQNIKFLADGGQAFGNELIGKMNGVAIHSGTVFFENFNRAVILEHAAGFLQ